MAMQSGMHFPKHWPELTSELKLGSVTLLERFQLEVRSAGRLHHPHIVPVFEVGQADETHFYAMQFWIGRCATAPVASSTVG